MTRTRRYLCSLIDFSRRLCASWWLKVPIVIFSSLAAVVFILIYDTRAWTWYDFDRWEWKSSIDDDVKLYLSTQKGCDPLLEDLRVGRIRKGDDLQELIARAEPAAISSYKEYTLICYALPEWTTVRMTAKDGKLVEAVAYKATSDGYCKWFFNYSLEADNSLNNPERSLIRRQMSAVTDRAFDVTKGMK
jgi:hypothetical protein